MRCLPTTDEPTAELRHTCLAAPPGPMSTYKPPSRNCQNSSIYWALQLAQDIAGPKRFGRRCSGHSRGAASGASVGLCGDSTTRPQLRHPANCSGRSVSRSSPGDFWRKGRACLTNRHESKTPPPIQIDGRKRHGRGPRKRRTSARYNGRKRQQQTILDERKKNCRIPRPIRKGSTPHLRTANSDTAAHRRTSIS